MDRLFPAWGLTLANRPPSIIASKTRSAPRDVAEWYWAKVTTMGEPVFHLASASSRRCYEGESRPSPAMVSITHESAVPGLVLAYHNPTRVELPPLPLQKLFLALPLGHSRKPVILDLVREFLPKPTAVELSGAAAAPMRNPNILELFARTTLAGHIAVGNESIKFNVVEDVKAAHGGWILSRDTAEENAPGV